MLLCVVMRRTTSSLSPMALALMLSPPARSRSAYRRNACSEPPCAATNALARVVSRCRLACRDAPPGSAPA